MKKILFLALLSANIASSEVLLFSGTGDAEGRTYKEAREYSLKDAHEDAQDQANNACMKSQGDRALLCGSFEDHVVVERVMLGRLYISKAVSVGKFQCGMHSQGCKTLQGINVCPQGERLCRTAWGGIEYCAARCED